MVVRKKNVTLRRQTKKELLSSQIFVPMINHVNINPIFFHFIRKALKAFITFQKDECNVITPLIIHLRQETERLMMSCAEKTTANRKTAVNNLERFFIAKMNGGEDINIKNLTPEILQAFERWRIDSGIKLSSSANDMRNLRALINSISSQKNNLFAGVHTSVTQAQKKSIGKGGIKSVESLQLDTTIKEYRDYFMFGFHAMGIPPIDMAFLKKGALQGNTLTYYRHKTHRKVSITVNENLKALIDKIACKGTSSYLLPILKSENPAEAMKEYHRFYQRYRYGLNKLSAMLDDHIRLTAYTPRHTWASIAYEAGVSVNIISQVLGHASIRTTTAYLADICSNRISEAYQQVMNYVKKEEKAA